MNSYSRSGYNLQGIINDLKRRPEDAAADLQLPLHEFNDYLFGIKEMPSDIKKSAARIWGINERDFYLIEDDCPTGVKVMNVEESAKTSRIMERAGKPYYEYRDTAMSTVAQFRPEWIKELCIVDDNDPDNPAVQWNNGHFLQQFTYFVGPVNFYYKGKDGNKDVAVMNTGDSMYITPFVPHTFAMRRNDTGESGLILALTYGNKLAGETQQELAALGPELVAGYALDFSSREKAIASLLHFHRESASLDYNELARRTKIPHLLLREFETGNMAPIRSNLELVASALNIDIRELLPPDILEQKVVVKNYDQALTWDYISDKNPSYRLVELAGTNHLPHSKSLEVNILTSNHKVNLDLKVGLHQYGYNIGNIPIIMNWQLSNKDHREFIHPGDSFYVKPFIPHNFRGKGGKLLILRIGGRMAGEPQRELSLIGKENVTRAVGELTPWFNKEGRNKV